MRKVKGESLQNDFSNHPRSISVSRVWGNGDFVHICFESRGCRFRKKGYCIMCDYGSGRNVAPEEAVEALDAALKGWPVPVHSLLLGVCGSILDEFEMNRKVLAAIFEYLRDTDIERFILETHYITVSDDSLAFIGQMLAGKSVAIEMGFESANPAVLKSLNKYMDLAQLERAMGRIRSYQMEPILNIFLGAPGLSLAQQIQDALDSVRWAFGHGAGEIVVFPANIKPGTKLWDLYQSGEYGPVSHWLLIELLSGLTDGQLSMTAVSWYGDRQEAGHDLDIIPPVACEECRPALMEFYKLFMGDFDAVVRKGLLEKLKGKVACGCYKGLLGELYKWIR